MITFLRSNRPSFLVLSPLLALGCCIGALLLAEVPYASTGWDWFDTLMQAQVIIRGFALAALIWLQAYVLYRMCVVGGFFQQNTQSPALMWSLLAGAMSIMETNFSLQLALFFSLLSAIRLVRIYRQNRVMHLVFEAGFWAGLAMLFEPGMVVLLASLVLSVAYTRTSDWREWAALLLGITAPWYMCILLSFVLIGRIVVPEVSLGLIELPEVGQLHTVFWLILLLTGGIVGLIAFLRSFAEDNNQSRTAKNNMLFYCVAVLFGLSWFADGALVKYYTGSLPALGLFIPFVLFLPRRSGSFLATACMISVVLYCGFILAKGLFV